MSEDLEPGDIPEYDFTQPDALLFSANLPSLPTVAAENPAADLQLERNQPAQLDPSLLAFGLPPLPAPVMQLLAQPEQWEVSPTFRANWSSGDRAFEETNGLVSTIPWGPLLRLQIGLFEPPLGRSWSTASSTATLFGEQEIQSRQVTPRDPRIRGVVRVNPEFVVSLDRVVELTKRLGGAIKVVDLGTAIEAAFA
jgi:hypothetical protein